MVSARIVVGSHGARGINRLLGSTASYVLSHADCDVLTVPLKRLIRTVTIDITPSSQPCVQLIMGWLGVRV